MRNRRTLLAKIALLTDMPVPFEVNFKDADGAVRICLDSVTDGVKWARFLGRPDAQGLLNEGDGYTYLQSYPAPSWDGWLVLLWAVDSPQPDQPLSDEDRTELEALTGGE